MLAEKGEGPTTRLFSDDIISIIQHNFSGQIRQPAFNVFARKLEPFKEETTYVRSNVCLHPVSNFDCFLLSPHPPWWQWCPGAKEAIDILDNLRD